MSETRPPQPSSHPPPAHSAPERRDFAAIFLVSAALIVFQIALTRILSVVAWYHFAFLTISMVMLGLGAPGVWLASSARPQRWLQPMLLLSGLAIPASVVALLRWGAAAREASPLLLIAFVLPATLALGAVVCLLLMRASGPSISRMYGVDLVGACLGALLVIPLLHVVPTPTLVVGCGLLPLVALALRPGPFRVAAGGLALALLALPQTGLLQVTRSKGYYDERQWPPIFEKWSPTARLAVFDVSPETRAQRGGFTWGRGSRAPDQEHLREYWLEQDGSAGTPITHFDGDFSKIEHFLYDVTTLGYQLRPRQSATIIGAGGGRDILSALMSGVSDVEAIELNRHTIGALSGPFGEFSGNVYHRPGVHAHAAEGRSFLTASRRKYDLIQISLIDSWAASAAGAFALAENNLYTIEAFELYSSRLSENGVLSTSRWLREMPRLIILARAALEKMRVPAPERHLMLASAGHVGTLLLSQRPFEPSDIQRFAEVCAERGFSRVYPPSPNEDVEPRLRDLIQGDYGFLAELGLSTRPPVDDSPYFFQTVSPFASSAELSPESKKATGLWFNLESTKLLHDTMWWVTGLAILLFFLPFVRLGEAYLWQRLGRRPARGAATARPHSLLAFARASLYFAAIGAGFMLQESMLMQRFVLYLGHPSYAATVILASLLLGMGVGSALSARVGLARLQRFGILIPLLLVAAVALTRPLFQASLALPLALRIVLSCLLLGPLGAALGLFFPLGMLRFGDTYKPWYWAINGAFGVVASVLSLALSMQFGFTLVGYASAAMYVAAWLCLGSQLGEVRARVAGAQTVAA